MTTEYKIIDNSSSPGPLGFIGLGLAASMLGLQGLGCFSDSLIVISMSIFMGGFAQLIAGVQFWKKGDTFSSTAFTSFGFFWFSFAYVLISPFGIEVASSKSIACYLILWSIYSFFMLLGTFKIRNKLLIIMFLFLVLTFLFTGLANLGFQLSVLPAIVTFSLGIISIYISISMIFKSLDS